MFLSASSVLPWLVVVYPSSEFGFRYLIWRVLVVDNSSQSRTPTSLAIETSLVPQKLDINVIVVQDMLQTVREIPTRRQHGGSTMSAEVWDVQWMASIE